MVFYSLSFWNFKKYNINPLLGHGQEERFAVWGEAH